MTKKNISYLWQVIYVKPKGWLCSIQSDKLLHFVVSFILMEIMCGVWGKLVLGCIGYFYHRTLQGDCRRQVGDEREC